MKRYAVVYKERYKKVTKIISRVMKGNKLIEIQDKFDKEVQEYSMFGEPKYTILRVTVMRGN